MSWAFGAPLTFQELKPDGRGVCVCVGGIFVKMIAEEVCEHFRNRAVKSRKGTVI